MVMSDFRTVVEVWPFWTCAVKNMQQPLLYIIGAVRSLWTCYGTNTSFTERV